MGKKLNFTRNIKIFTCPATWGTRKYERTSAIFEPCGQPMIRLCLCTCWVDLSTRFTLFVMKCIKIKIINDTKFMLVSFDVNLMYTLINVRCTRAEKYFNSNATWSMFDAHAQKNILIVMLQIFDNLFHYKNIVTVQWIKRLKLCMVTMATLPPAKELKIQVVSWQNEIRTLDVLKSPTCTSKRYFKCSLGVQFWCYIDRALLLGERSKGKYSTAKQ